MRVVSSMLLTAVFSIALGGEALAQEAPNLVGTWKGTAHAVHLGSNPYRTTNGQGANFPDNGLEFTFVIKEQHGNRFAGESTGGTRTETIIGALQPDNRGGYMIDDDGEYALSLVDPNTMDVCYRHSLPDSKVVACYPIKRMP